MFSSNQKKKLFVFLLKYFGIILFKNIFLTVLYGTKMVIVFPTWI